MTIILKLAYTYENQLQQLFKKIIFQEKYKYYNYSNYWTYNLKLSENSWDSIEMVSVDEENYVRGFLSASINRIADSVSSLGIINFYDVNIVFAKDLYQFIKDLFLKFNFRKIEFIVVVGNPIEKMYDKYIQKYNGRIVGIKKQSTKLQDNKYYDVKMYEIFRDDCIHLLK